MLHRLSIEKKFLLLIVSTVIAAIAVLTALVVRRETMLIRDDHRKKAVIVTTAIGKALKDNMLMGHPEETERLIDLLSRVEGIGALTVLKPNGDRAFGMSGPESDIDREILRRLPATNETAYSLADDGYFVTPLANEESCRSCHDDREAIRGYVVVGMSGQDIGRNIADLVERMTGFGALSALILSGLLVVFSRRMLLSPLKGLTDAANRIAAGDFVLYRPRGTHCREILRCEKRECPSYDDTSIPCWLQKGTLCHDVSAGNHMEKSACSTCRVYREKRGDEVTQLTDNFNMMSLSLKRHEEEMAARILEIEGLNQELIKSNTKLGTLLEASRLSTSTLELEQTLSSTLRIILDVTSLKAGIILLLDEDLTKKCYEFFDCAAHNCPAYRAEANCWSLSGTMCHGDASSCPDGLVPTECWHRNNTHTHLSPSKGYQEKISACSDCSFFANIVLIPKMVAGFTDGRLGKRLRPDGGTIHKALLMGRTLVNYSNENPFNIPMDTVTEIAMPLKVKDQITGILYLASDMAHHYSKEEIEYFQFLSEVISSGIFNSRLFEDVETSYFQTVMALANAIEAKDPYTRGHSERVAEFSMKAAGAMNLSRQEMEHLRFAAILHDVGKIGIGRDLLRKDGALDPMEEKEVRSHPERGVQILDPIHFLKPVLPAIRHHHERFDGSGYPLGLKGREIPLKARILCVADAWDAMLSKRPYRDPLPLQHAKDELIRHSGTQFDPEVVESFIRAMSPEQP